MSYCYIHGIVPVCDGKKVQTQRPNTSPVWHAVYDTMFFTESGREVQGLFRTFSPASASTLPSNILVEIHGKFSMPPNSDGTAPSEFLIEPLNHEAFTMDPTEEKCDAFLPSNTVPTIEFCGIVCGSIVQLNDGGKAVDVRVSNYMQSKVIDSIYR